MCEQCRYSQIETVSAIVAKARPDQLLRLLRDIRRGDQSSGGAQA